MCNMPKSPGGTKMCSLLPRQCVKPYDLAVHLYSAWSRNWGHSQNLAREKEWDCWLKRNTPPPICNVEKGLNHVSKVKFSQQVEVQKGSHTIASLGGGGIGWRPSSGLAKVWPRSKTGLFQTIAAPLASLPQTKTGKVCVTGGTVLRVNGVWARVCLSDEKACKGMCAPESADPNMGKHTEDHLQGFRHWTHETAERVSVQTSDPCMCGAFLTLCQMFYSFMSILSFIIVV